MPWLCFPCVWTALSSDTSWALSKPPLSDIIAGICNKDRTFSELGRSVCIYEMLFAAML